MERRLESGEQARRKDVKKMHRLLNHRECSEHVAPIISVNKQFKYEIIWVFGVDGKGVRNGRADLINYSSIKGRILV